MSAAITIAMPRMVPNQLLAEAHAKYPESLARAGAEMRWIELDDPEKAVSPTFCGIPPSRCCCAPSLPPTSRCWPSAGASS